MHSSVVYVDGVGVISPAHHERSLVESWLGSGVGTFVEVGAGDPIRGSQTYHLELNGWAGLLVEPSTELANALKAVRKAHVACVACGAPGSPSTTQLWLLGREARAILYPGDLPRGTLRVPVRTLDDVLGDVGISSVDFVSIDVTGTEADVLAGFSASRFNPRLILVDDRVGFGRSRRLLAAHGYILARRTGHNAWFVPRALRRTSLTDQVTLAWHYGPGRLVRRLVRRFLA